MTEARSYTLLIHLKQVSALLAIVLAMSCFSSVSHARIFGIPGTVIDRTLLQAGPGWAKVVRTTLLPQTSVQVMCKVEDALVGDDPWWLKVHVWSSGMEGWVTDFYVKCRHAGNCNVPFCV